MSKREIDKKTFEALGKTLVKNDQLPLSEIDRIIAAPGLFDLVNRRIVDAEKTAVNSSVPSRSRWIPAAAVSMACVVVITIVGANMFRQNTEIAIGPSAITEIEVPGAGPELARPEIPPKEVFGKLSPGRASYQKTRRPDPAKRPKPRVKTSPVTKPQLEVPANEFYAISFTGEGEVTGGRVIRVDMPRSSLFALGMNVPLENGPELVKTDLLIGADGTPKGIRLVE